MQPQQDVLDPYHLCRFCGLICHPNTAVYRSPEDVRPHTRAELSAKPQVLRYFAQGCARVTIATCPDCGRVRAVLAG
jgi:hypothetical protein